MRTRSVQIAVAVALACAGTSAMAQTTTTTRSGTQTYYQPYEARYWSYGGISVGRSDYDVPCPAGFGCDRREYGFKLFAGGKSHEFVGVEAAYVYLGEANRGGGDTWGQGLNLSLVGTVPLGQAFALNGRVGGIYGWTKTEGTAGARMATGREHGLGLSYGVGASFALSRQVDLRLDWDRYRMKFSTGRDDVDFASIGVAYKF